MERPICHCGNNCKPNGYKVSGERAYYKVCSSCLRRRNKQGVSGSKGGRKNTRESKLHLYYKFKKSYCEKCGFISKHECQLDVDHIDGDSNNHSEGNLMTLCSNCHRLKTKLKRDWTSKPH